MSERVDIRLPGGEVLRGDLRLSRSALAVVYVHGLGSHRGGDKALALADECQRRGLSFFAFDFRGHGESDGTTRELTATRLLEDLSAVRDFLESRGHQRLGLVGSSMGAFAAAWFAARHPEVVASCVLIAPAFRFLDRQWERLSDRERADWARAGVRRVQNEWIDLELRYGLMADRSAFDAAELARGWRTPLLIFHGLADDLVPAVDSLEFAAASPYPGIELRLWKAGDHRLTVYKEEIAAEACRFLERVAGQKVQS
jgi:uncharacterized protein